jgi:hypothetical protein
MLRESKRVADRRHPRSILLGSEIARRLRERIAAIVLAAVPLVACFMKAMVEILQIVFQVFVEVSFDRGFEGRLIVFHGNDAVAAAVHNLFDDVSLSRLRRRMAAANIAATSTQRTLLVAP